MIKSGEVRTWLYTSEFTDEMTHVEVNTLVSSFIPKNERLGATGFLITNGRAVMQLLEGAPEVMTTLQAAIMADARHLNITSEVWELETARAYPNWSMRVIDPSEYEDMFKEIEVAKIETIATDIARLLFDLTFAP